MKILLKSEAAMLLQSVGMKIGAWNEVVGASDAQHLNCQAPLGGRELFEFVERIVKWMAPETWLLFQFDNSTFPKMGEEKTFDALIGRVSGSWDIGFEKSFLLECLSPRAHSMAVLLSYISLLFEWHVHVVSANRSRRLSLQDGVVHFFGDGDAICEAQTLL